MVAFKDVIVILLVGIAIVLGLVLSVYLISILFDKGCVFCRGNNTPYILTPEELQERQHASDLIRQSGLAGILPSERLHIFQYFFQQRALIYKSESAKTNDIVGETATDTKDEGKDLESQGPTEPSEKSTVASSTAESNTDDGEDQELKELCMLNHEDGTCPICLNQYAQGDKVITGSSCSHLFHLDCCLQWLEKGNSHCAYCRKDMMSPTEFAQAARDALGEDRANKISRINADAARRLAEYEAAVAQGADNTTASRALATGTLPGDIARRNNSSDIPPPAANDPSADVYA